MLFLNEEQHHSCVSHTNAYGDGTGDGDGTHVHNALAPRTHGRANTAAAPPRRHPTTHGAPTERE